MQYNKRKKKNFVERVHLSLDVAIASFSFVSAYALKKYILPVELGGLSIAPNYYIVLAQIITAWLIADNVFTPYKSFSRKKFLRIVIDNIKMVSSVLTVIIISSFIFKTDISRLLLALFSVITFILLLLSKCFLTYLYIKHYSRERNKLNVIIVGTKGRAKQVIDHIHSYKKHYKIIGCLDTHSGQKGLEVKNGCTVIGTLDDLKQIVLNTIVDEIIFAMPLEKIESIDMYILLIEMLGIPVRIFPDWYLHSTVFQPGISKVCFDSFGGSPTMLLTATNQNHLNLLLKQIIDTSAAFILLILLLPFFALTGILIKLFSKGPVFFSQNRMGLNGRLFKLYKFRTMVPDAEERLKELQALNEADGPAFKITKDPRIIPYIGTFLRKSSMDELPQLFNVICGDMSLVGPRPPLPSEVEKYNVWQRRRLSMKPGLTCLWQIKPNRNDLSFNEWMSLDLNYIDNWSLKLDLSILAQTAFVVIGVQGR